MCYTQICPRFECRDEHTIHTCVYCVLTLNAGPGRGVCVCVCVFSAAGPANGYVLIGYGSHLLSDLRK